MAFKPRFGVGDKPMFGAGGKPLICDTDEDCCVYMPCIDVEWPSTVEASIEIDNLSFVDCPAIPLSSIATYTAIECEHCGDSAFGSCLWEYSESGILVPDGTRYVGMIIGIDCGPSTFLLHGTFRVCEDPPGSSLTRFIFWAFFPLPPAEDTEYTLPLDTDLQEGSLDGTCFDTWETVPVMRVTFT